MRLAALTLALILAAFPALAGPLTIVGLDGRTAQVSAADFADLPRAEATMIMGHGGQPKTFEGATVTSLLRLVGAPVGATIHGKPVTYYLAVTGADGYMAVLSLTETDAAFHDGAVILADKAKDGPLQANEGTYRLVVDGDKVSSRSVRDVVRVEVRRAE